MGLKRHSLLDITDSGREAILAELAGSGPDSSMFWESYARVLLPDKAGARVPGIVRREEEALRPGYIPIGFSAPVPGKTGRLRLAAFTRLEDIVQTTNPYELLSRSSVPPRNPCTRALVAAKSQAQASGLCLGVWGSVASELYTGLPCTHQNSDLDLLVALAPREVLSQYLLKITAIEADFALRIDIELDLPNGYGVHLKELFGQGRSVLGKSLTDVAMFPRERILSELPTEQTLQSAPCDAVGQHG